MTCKAVGPYLPVGSTDWECRAHAVALDASDNGLDLLCPVTGVTLAHRLNARTGFTRTAAGGGAPPTLRDLANALNRGLVAANERARRRFVIDLDDPALRARLLEAVDEIWNRSDPSAMPLADSYGLDVDRVLAALPTPKETT